MPGTSQLDTLPQPAVDALRQLSARLWGEGTRLGDGGPKTFGALINRGETEAFVTAITAYAAGVRPIPLSELAARLRGGVDGKLAMQSAAFLVTGTLALGMSGRLKGDTARGLLDTLLHAAFGLDDLSRRMRDLTLTGLLGWPQFPGGDPPFPTLDGGCLEDIRATAGRAGGYVYSASGPTGSVSFDADGITSLDPTEGSASDIVRIYGNFPVDQPLGRCVVFPRAGGGTLLADPGGLAWGQNMIAVVVPEPPGDGPVGFIASSPDSIGITDPSGMTDFANTLAACLGPRAAGIAGRLTQFGPQSPVRPQPVPRLPGDVNVFHGGPVLTKVSAAGGAETDPPFTVAGLNLRSVDTVYLDETLCSTTFLDADHVSFRIGAIPSGHKLLRIGRGHHRSNGIGFEVRATVNTTPPSGRVTPDSTVTLHGTGFGSDTTVTIEGLPTSVYVVDTHSIQFRVSRPPREPALADKRGEPVTVEVFDRFVSIGTVQLHVATFRIATFGDSIVWGQGLPPAQRFSMLAATVVAARRSGRIAVFAADHCAHSGAVIMPLPGEPTNFAVPRASNVFTGECPNRMASITGQVAAWPLRFSAEELGEIDLVILDGGINDVDVTNILNPLASDSGLAVLTMASCGTAMSGTTVTPGLLPLVLATFPNARVVVTGYYPIVSAQTDLDLLLPLLGSLGLLIGVLSPLVPGIVPVGLDPVMTGILKKWLHGKLTTRSRIFATTANTALAGAVATALAAAPGRRIAFASPAFGSANAIFGPVPFVFGVTPGLGPEDPVAMLRAAACGSGSLITTIASIGHPNAKGAQAYADAIAAVLPSLGL